LVRFVKRPSCRVDWSLQAPHESVLGDVVVHQRFSEYKPDRYASIIDHGVRKRNQGQAIHDVPVGLLGGFGKRGMVSGMNTRTTPGTAARMASRAIGLGISTA
jgi:hypothetical protein